MVPSDSFTDSPAVHDSKTSPLPIRPRPDAELRDPTSSPQERAANLYLDPRSSPFLNVPSSTSPSSKFVFGGAKNDSTAFTFRSLHNASPQPPMIFRKPSTPQQSAVFQEGKTPDSSESKEKRQPKQDDPISEGDPSLFSAGFSPPALTGSRKQQDHSSRLQPQISLTVSPLSSYTQLNPYDVRDERGPDEPFYTTKFQKSLKSGMELAKEAHQALCEMQPDSTAQGLKNLAESLIKYRNSQTKTIAILGDSGEGKSSLVNSLLHYPGIAQTSDLGSACTSVVTEYCWKTPEHKAPITVEVEHLSRNEVQELIKELVWNYRKLYLPGVEREEISAAEYTKYERESTLAWATLEAAFKHRRDFKPEFLQDQAEGASKRIVDQLIQWTEDLEWPNGDDESDASGLWKSTAQTAAECCTKTAAFMKDRLWPFTKIIRVYLSSQVLKTGIVLADLPGLQDTNLARVRTTQDYLLRCDYIFIVAKISRAITDQSLKSSLYQVLSRHVPLEWETNAGRFLNVAVICTRTEEIDEEKARLEFCGAGKRIEPDVIDKLDLQIQDAKESKDRKLKKRLQRKRQFLFVEARNEMVKECLRTAYAAKVPGNSLEVFCISNTTYEKYTRKGDIDMIAASGIPSLRSFCYSVTAQKQLLEAQHFLKSRLGVLLNSMEIWVDGFQENQSNVAQSSSEEITDALYELEVNISDLFDFAKESFTTCFKDQILKLSENRNRYWEQAAEQKGSSWFSWHWTQYNAWCLNNGDHYTAKRGAVNWNQELIWKMRSELDFQWEVVEEEMAEIFEELLHKLESELDGFKVFLKRLAVPPTIENSIDLQIEVLKHQHAQYQDNFSRELRTIRRKASEGNAISYIVREMTPSYRSASLESGPGMSARQKSTVQGRIENGTLFPNISINIQTDVEKQADRILNALKTKVLEILPAVRSDLGIALGESDGTESANEDSHELQQQQENLKEVLKMLKQRHENILKDISS